MNMHSMHSSLGEIHSASTRVFREPRRAAGMNGSATKTTVAYAGQTLHLELKLGDLTLLAGNWTADIAFDGEPVAAISDFEETCWVSDKDVNYLELEIHLAGGLRLERHVVYARQDQLVFLADAVFGPRSGKIDYRGRLPLAADVQFKADAEHTEGAIVAKKRMATVFPIALPEWRTPQNTGTLEMHDGKLELALTATGKNLFAPLLFDLNARRFNKPLTWRQLTVAEMLAIQPPDSSVGYRVKIGKEQWLIYRSLSPKANRTLLGHNLSSEFLFARFMKGGEVQSLIEVE